MSFIIVREELPRGPAEVEEEEQEDQLGAWNNISTFEFINLLLNCCNHKKCV